MNTADPPPEPIDLAHAPDFRLGPMQVSPSRCRVVLGDRETRLEPRVMEVLLVLAQARGATVSKDELIAACWGGRIVSEDAVARVIGKVRALARDADPPPFELETIPRVGFRLTSAGFEPAEAPAPPARQPAKPPPNRPGLWVLAAVAALVLAIGVGVAIWRGGVDPAADSAGRVEVMAFEARDPDPGLARIATSVGDGLLHGLSQVGIRVEPKVHSRDLGGPESRAEFRIGGAVERNAELTVVNVQAIDRETGLLLWSGRFEQPTADAASLANDVAAGVAGVLHCGLEGRKHWTPAPTMAQFGLSLQACDAIIRRNNPERMLAITRKLADAAPRSAFVVAMHAVAQANVAASLDQDPQEIAELRNAARADARRALAIDPQEARAYFAIALSYPNGSAWDEREAALARVDDLDPSFAPATLIRMSLLREVGRLNEALELSRRLAAVSDPRAPSHSAVEVFLLAQTGRANELATTLASLERQNPADARSLGLIVNLWWAPPEAGLRWLEAHPEVPAEGPGRRRCYKRHLEAVASGRPVQGVPAECDGFDIDWRIRMLARQGDLDGAWALLEQPMPNSRNVLFFLYYPELRALRADPRFMPFTKRVGLLDHWSRTGKWPDFCADPDLPYDCRAEARRLGAGRP